MKREDWAFWREMDSDRRYLGIRLWFTGGEVCIGKRMWRWRYGWIKW